MIEKMKFLSFTGPKKDIDRFVLKYLSKYEIHLENALAQLGQDQKNVTPYIEANPYREALNKAKEFEGLLGSTDGIEKKEISLSDAMDLVKELDQRLVSLKVREDQLTEKIRHTEKLMQDIKPFRSLPCPMEKMLNFEFIRCRFGRVNRQYYDNFQNYVYEHLETVFVSCSQDEEYVWGVYFVPRPQQDRVNAVFSSMHFERIYLENVYQGTPEAAYQELERQVGEIRQEIRSCHNEMTGMLQSDAIGIVSAAEQLSTASDLFDVRKMAGCVKEHNDQYYILCGWMAAGDADRLMAEIDDDPDVVCVAEDNPDEVSCKPPTKLKNPAAAKPFEMYIRMYGLPGYKEIDPTIFVAITYSFIFGAMFGDVGQGLCLVIGGFLLYRMKKIDLAGILGMAGIFSTIFGFLFGSFFGFEDVIPALWLRPVSAMMQIPMLGRINTVFVVAIGFGMALNLLVMVLHIIEGTRSRDPERTFFDANAVAGLVFYGSLFAALMLLISGHTVPGGALLVVLILLPILVIAFKEPLANLVEKKKEIIPGSKGMFFVEAFFELFDVMLSYFSNTVSFVRIGAFAVSHAAMMEVVLMLAGAEAGGNPNWIVIVLGNAFVCLMEGLIVGIQVLRLEYYELFSRFYQGDGKEFVPFIRRKKKA